MDTRMMGGTKRALLENVKNESREHPNEAEGVWAIRQSSTLYINYFEGPEGGTKPSSG